MKRTFRKNILNKRESLSSDYVTEKSELIISNLMTLDFINQANHIMLYLDFRNEVSTSFLIQELFSQGKHVSCPITNTKDKELIPVEISDIEKDVHIGTFNVREPNNTLRRVPIDQIDLVIVPLVAASSDGYRLGYGGGYYDRFLSNMRPDTITIGFAYEMQVFDTIPTEEHDIKLDYIITENRIISTL